MAVNRYLNVDGNWTNTANWSTTFAPVDTDAIQIIEGNQSIITNISQGAIDPASLYFGGSFTGSIGDATNALTLGVVSGTIRLDLRGPSTQIMNLAVTSCPKTIITATGANTNACFLKAGTYTNVYCYGGPSIRIGAAAVVTNLHVGHDPTKAMPNITIESGATVTTIRTSAGLIYSSAALTTLQADGTARVFQVGSGAGNITTIRAHGQSVVYLRGAGFTVTDFEVRENAEIDSQTESYRAWTFTNAGIIAGGTVRAKSIDTFTAAPDLILGKFLHTSSPTVVLPGNPS